MEELYSFAVLGGGAGDLRRSGSARLDHDLRTSGFRGKCPRRLTVRSAPLVAMGLNANSLRKAKRKGKGGKKGGRSATVKRAGEPRASPSTIDVHRREYIFQMHRLSKTLASGKKLLNNINLSFFPGAKIGLLGENGSGKTTLLKIMAGVDKEFDGEALPQAGIRIGYLEQDPRLVHGETVTENVEESVKEVKAWLKRYEELTKEIGREDLGEGEKTKIEKEWSRLQDKIEAANGWELDRNISRALDALRCPPGNALVKHLSGGERRRVALCTLLLKRPELLVLDEPTNELDAESVLWLERFLETYTGTVVAVTHDRYFLDNLTQWILELDEGKGIPYEGCYSTYLEKKANRLEAEEKIESSRRKLIKAELAWMRSTPKGRQAKSKARVSRYDELLRQANDAAMNRKVTLDRIYIPPGGPLGDIVVEAKDARKVYGDRVLFENMSFSLPRGGIVGVVGANGTGKSTLFKIILGQETLDGGSITVGQTVDIAYVDQDRSAVDREKTVFEDIADNEDEIVLGNRTVKSRAYLSWFNFKGSNQQKKVGNLSGGERSRLNMAKAFMKGSNLLLLDEPTNDGDSFFLKSLEDALLNYAGCAVIISHDRFFLDRVATHILAFEGDSKVRWHEGNWQSYLEDKFERLGDTTPSRVKFAKLPVM